MRALPFAVLLLLGFGCATSGPEKPEPAFSRGLDMPPPDQSALPEGNHEALPLKMRDEPREKDRRPQSSDLE